MPALLFFSVCDDVNGVDSLRGFSVLDSARCWSGCLLHGCVSQIWVMGNCEERTVIDQDFPTTARALKIPPKSEIPMGAGVGSARLGLGAVEQGSQGLGLGAWELGGVSPAFRSHWAVFLLSSSPKSPPNPVNPPSNPLSPGDRQGPRLSRGSGGCSRIGLRGDDVWK